MLGIELRNLRIPWTYRLCKRLAGDASLFLNTLYYGIAVVLLIAGCRIGSTALLHVSHPVHVHYNHPSPATLRLYRAQCRIKSDMPADMAPCVDEAVVLTAIHATGNPPGTVPWAMAQLSDGSGAIRVRISDPSVLTSLQPGSSLLAEVWHDRITTVETYTRTIITDDSPAYVPPRAPPPPPWYDAPLNPNLVEGAFVALPGLILMLLPLIWAGGGRAQTKRQALAVLAILVIRLAIKIFAQTHPLF